ncbi:hypothetical protein ACQKWADRAFT_59428 [Trichoderma austrokoningii]
MTTTWSKGRKRWKTAPAGSSLRLVHARYSVGRLGHFPSAISIIRFPAPGTQFPPISHEHGARLEPSVGLPDELPERKGARRRASHLRKGFAWDSADRRDGSNSMLGSVPVSVSCIGSSPMHNR